MKIVQETPELLEVSHRPWIAPAFCIVLFAAEIGVLATRGESLGGGQWAVVSIIAAVVAVAGVVSSVSTTLRLDARGRAIFWRRWGPVPFANDEFEGNLDGVVGVGVEELVGDAETGPTLRVVVRTRSRRLPLRLGYSNYEDHQRVAETLRRWLAQAGVTLER